MKEIRNLDKYDYRNSKEDRTAMRKEITSFFKSIGLRGESKVNWHTPGGIAFSMAVNDVEIGMSTWIRLAPLTIEFMIEGMFVARIPLKSLSSLTYIYKGHYDAWRFVWKSVNGGI